MARIAGIKFENDTKGKRRYVRIDLKKYSKDINPFLEKVGAVEPDDFEQQWASSITGEELKQSLHQFIASHPYWVDKEGRK